MTSTHRVPIAPRAVQLICLLAVPLAGSACAGAHSGAVPAARAGDLAAQGASARLVPAPAGLRVTGRSTGAVSLAWHPGGGALTYHVYRGGLAVGRTTGTRVTLGGLSCGRLYVFGVRAVAASGGYSAIAQIAGRASPCSNECSGVEVTPQTSLRGAVAAAPAGTTFCVSGRHAVDQAIVPKDGDTFIGVGGAVIDGARRLTDWAAAGTTWVSDSGPSSPTIMSHRPPTLRFPQSIYEDDLILDGRPLWKVGVQLHGDVIGSGPGTVGPGSYFVNYDTHQVVLGSDPSGHHVELADTADGFRGAASGVKIAHMVVQGFTSTGIFMPGRGRWTALRNTIRANHESGIQLGSTDRALSNTVTYNGDDGISGAGSGVVMAGNVVMHNDAARVDLANGSCYDGAGAKFVLTRNLLVAGNVVVGNECHGLWFDINTLDSSIRGNLVAANRGDGILHEISYRGLVQANTVWGNRFYGIDVTNSPDDTVRDNTVRGNRAGGIFFFDENRRHDPARFGPLVVRNLRVYRNTTILRTTSEAIGGVDYTNTPSIFSRLGNRFTLNTYVLPATRGAREFRWAGRRLTRTGWRAAGNDVNGVFASR